jgi:hypothetical protein
MSCGKNGIVTNVSPPPQEACDNNGGLTSCETVEGAEGDEIDLLESMIDVRVRTTESEIEFLEDKNSVATGKKILCETGVKKNEIHFYSLEGNKLWIKTSVDSYEMERLNEGEGLRGTWIWKGTLSQGTRVIRSLTFVHPSQVIKRTTCEF